MCPLFHVKKKERKRSLLFYLREHLILEAFRREQDTSQNRYSTVVFVTEHLQNHERLTHASPLNPHASLRK